MIGILILAAVAGPDPICAARVASYQPPAGVIKSPLVAVRVARLYLDAVYGIEVIKRELPLEATLSREVWRVKGKDLPPMTDGGVAEIELCQSNGRILSISHGK